VRLTDGGAAHLAVAQSTRISAFPDQPGHLVRRIVGRVGWDGLHGSVSTAVDGRRYVGSGDGGESYSAVTRTTRMAAPWDQSGCPIRRLLARLGWASSDVAVTAAIHGMMEEERLHFGIAAAQAWGTQYFASQGLGGFPMSLGVAGDAELLASGSIAEVARRRHALVALNRLSAARVDEVCLPILQSRGHPTG
jgi:hypothetical protein